LHAVLVLDELVHERALRSGPSRDLLVVAPPGDVADGDVVARLPPQGQAVDGFVDPARAERAAEDRDHDASVRKIERGARRGAIRMYGGVADGGPQRVAGDDGARQIGAREGDGSGSRAPRHETVGSARARVLLEDDDRDAPHDGREPAGHRRVAPERHHDLRPATAHDGERADHADDDAQRGGEIAQRQPTLDAAAGELVEREAGGRHEPRFHTGGAADEVDRGRLVAPLDERLRDGHAGQQVPAGAAPREDREGRPPAHRWNPGAVLATLSRIPDAAIVASSDEPPNEMNGSGTPVIGSTPITAPMFTKACTHSHVVMPTAMRRPNGSSARNAMRMPRNPSATNRPTTRAAPNRPSSSAMIAKMKSVCA